jgi:hypothetical protein
VVRPGGVRAGVGPLFNGMRQWLCRWRQDSPHVLLAVEPGDEPARRRAAELDRLGQALRHGAQDGGAVVISAIAGMAGVGKTQVAIHARHLLNEEKPLDRILFVNLRGFHADPAQPPADPAAVLDGFLRLLGVPGQQIPHDLPSPHRRLPSAGVTRALRRAATN